MSSHSEIPSSKDTTQATSSVLPSSTPSSKPPVTVQQGSHLDPGAYVRGSYPITIGQNVLIHPRAHLLSIHSPLIIGDGCVVSEKCVLGGPLPPATQQEKTSEPSDLSIEKSPDETKSARATVIEDLVHLHPNATISHGATIRTGAVIESNTAIESNVVIGSHSKICATLTMSATIPDWTVVWGTNANMKRRCRTGSLNQAKSSYEAVEHERIKAMQREREGTIAILRNAASKTLGGNSRAKK